MRFAPIIPPLILILTLFSVGVPFMLGAILIMAEPEVGFPNLNYPFVGWLLVFGGIGWLGWGFHLFSIAHLRIYRET